MTATVSYLVLLVLVTASVPTCRAKQEEAIPVNDTGEGTLCDQDQAVAKTCLACSALSFNTEVSLVECCSTDAGYQFCRACVEDQNSCSKISQEMEDFEKYADSDEEYYDDLATDLTYDDLYDGTVFDSQDDMTPDRPDDVRDKRFGTLFMKSPKRYGRLLFGKRVPEKRYGRLYMGSGSYFGKRSSHDLQDEPQLNSHLFDDDDQEGGDDIINKRFGYILGSRYKFGKRADEQANEVIVPRENGDMDKRFGYILGSRYKFGKREDGSDVDNFVPEKRYGQLFLGKSGWFGKRAADKRFGRLFMGSKGMFGKRSSPTHDDGDIAKRFGTLFMGRRRGKMFG